jgi:ATP-dependent Clp protease protease subunit
MVTPAPIPPETAPAHVYGVFVDDINQANSTRIVQGITGAIAAGNKHLHVMFQSWGGFVGDGVMLYNFFKSLSVVDLSLYNSGQVSSAAILAYLGAKRRVASPRSLFMIHKSHNSPQFASATKLERIVRSLVLDDERSETIWREHVNMPDELWTELQYHDLYLTGEEAVKFGLATELGDFAPPAGTNIYRV